MVKRYLTETEIVPYNTSPPPGERVLVLAPHPDDETFGCGGTIRMLVSQGEKVKVVFLTSGDKADPSNPEPANYIELREKEAHKALGILGVTDYEFLRFPDRGLFENFEDIKEKLLKIIEAYMPDTIYCPSMAELNPDHRAAAAAALEIQKKLDFRLALCEIATPVRINTLVDITGVIKIKLKAIKFYKSQLKIIDYLEINRSMNKFRTLTLDKKVQYAEGFFVIESSSEQGKIEEWLNYREPL